MKWTPQNDSYQGEYLVSDKYESEGVLFTSGRILIKDALIQDGYVFMNGRKSINYEKRNILVRYLDILETSVKYKLTFNTFLNILIRVLPIILLTLCLIGIAYLSNGDSQLFGRIARVTINTISVGLLVTFVPLYLVICVFKDNTFRKFYDATLCLVVNAGDDDPGYVIEKKVSSDCADDIRGTLRDHINYWHKIRNGIPNSDCVKSFSTYASESTVISEMGLPLGRSTPTRGLVERPDGVLDF